MHSHKCAEDEFGRRRRREVGEEEGEEKDEGDFHNHKQQRGSGWGQSRGRWGTAPTEGQDSNVRRPGVENHQNQNPYIPTPHDFGSPGPMAVSTPIVFNKSDNSTTITIEQWKELPWLERLKSQVRGRANYSFILHLFKNYLTQ